MAKFTTIADFTRKLRMPDRSPNNTLMTPMQAKTEVKYENNQREETAVCFNRQDDQAILRCKEESENDDSRENKYLQN